jgi:hypothetical protein
VGTYGVFAVYGFFNVWYKKGGNSNMLFFQNFVLKASFAIAFVNVVWNIQNWVADEENKEMVCEVIDNIIDRVIENANNT